MAAGDKPAIRVLVVSKTDKTRKRTIAAAWVSDDGSRLNGAWDKDVVAVKFSDGTVARREDCYLNVYDNRDEQRSPRREPAASASNGVGDEPTGDFGDDDRRARTSGA